MYLHELGESDASFTKEDMQLGYVLNQFLFSIMDSWIHGNEILCSFIVSIRNMNKQH